MHCQPAGRPPCPLHAWACAAGHLGWAQPLRTTLAAAGGYCEGAAVSWAADYQKYYLTRIVTAHNDRLRTLRFYLTGGAQVAAGPADG